MSVCKYCKIENRMRDFRGELLVVERINIGAIGDIDFEISIAESGGKEDGKPDELHIIMGDYRDADSILRKSLPINFCPICGRRLREEKENV